MSHHHRRAAAVSAPDPYFSNTVLLLTGNGTNGGQNNTFLDDSSNNFTITRNGNTTQGTFSPFGYNWSNYFDGSGDYLSLSASAISGVGSSNFSIECWVFATRQTNTYAQGLVSYGIAGSLTGTSFLSFQLSASGYLAVAYATGSSLTLTDTTLFPINQWVHTVVCRSGSTLSLFVNGTRVATATTSATVGNSGDTLFVGGQWYDTTAGRQLQGYIANARIVNGSSAYDATQSSLTVPTAPLTAITNTSLLTCQSNRFIDNSSNAFTITRNGDVRVSNFAPFPAGEYATSVEGGSGYFDGTGDYLTLNAGNSVDFGSGNFTIEGWVYPVGNQGAYDSIIARSTTTSPRFAVSFGSDGTTLECWCDGISASRVAASSTNVVNSWHHFAFVRNGTLFTLYVDGVAGATTTTSSSAIGASTDSVHIGADPSNLTGRVFNGYISSFRILKGTAQYSSTFTPSTTPLSSITNTSLLLNFTNGSIIDSTGKNDLETVGNAQIDTGTKKFGTGSLKFDGTGDGLIIPSNANFSFGTGDFTIEFWLYLAAQSSYIVYDHRSTSTQVVPTIYTSSGQIRYYANGADRITGSTLNATTWYHIAVARSGTSTKLFVNGVQSGSTYTDSNNYIQTPVSIGCYGPGITIFPFNGYIDDLRISKVARYNANFTPPYRQLPTR